MRILFGTNYKVGQTGHFAYLALTRMGIEVLPVTPTPDAPEGWLTVDPQVDILELYKSFPDRPDLLFLVESSTGTPFLPRNIEKLPITTAVWLYDNYLNFRWNKELAHLFDYCFFAQAFRVEQARRYGAQNVHWLPFAADEKYHRNFHRERDIDIGYLGTITEQKRRYFDALEKSGLAVTTNDRYLSFDEIGEFYSRCKLVYNILARRDMNVRTFEASAAGAVVVNQSWIDEGCRDIFTENENMMFHNFDDAPAICRELLADDDRRELIGKNAEELVMNEHTYRRRMDKMLAITSSGPTLERLERAASHRAPVAEALTCWHRDFGWRDRGIAKFKTAFATSILGTIAYLLRYGWWRTKEKIEKIVWSMGRAPV